MSVAQRAVTALGEGWRIRGRVQPLGQGLINDTFVVQGVNGEHGDWVLQRINPDVFPDPSLVMDNVVRVVRHLQLRAPGLVAGLVPTARGEGYYADGDHWRLWDFVADATTLQSLANEAQARSAGRAFARLQNALADLPGPELRPPIIGFMRMTHYLGQLDRELAKRSQPDAACRGAVTFIDARRDLADEFQQTSAYVHGDCKVNNLLFRGDEVCCVLDLDTVMIGHWAWDFGDLVRSGAAVGGRISLKLFRGLAQGFVNETNCSINERALILAPRYVGLMLGIRFLADHLAGDVYFRVQQHGDNLARAVAQFDLVRQLEITEQNMRNVVAGVI